MGCHSTYCLKTSLPNSSNHHRTVKMGRNEKSRKRIQLECSNLVNCAKIQQSTDHIRVFTFQLDKTPATSINNNFKSNLLQASFLLILYSIIIICCCHSPTINIFYAANAARINPSSSSLSQTTSLASASSSPQFNSGSISYLSTNNASQLLDHHHKHNYTQSSSVTSHNQSNLPASSSSSTAAEAEVEAATASQLRFRRHLQETRIDTDKDISLEDLMLASAQLREQLQQQSQIVDKRSVKISARDWPSSDKQLNSNRPIKRFPISGNNNNNNQDASILPIDCPELRLLWRVLEQMRFTHSNVLEQIVNQLSAYQIQGDNNEQKLKSKLMSKLYHFSKSNNNKLEEQPSWIDRLFSTLSPFRSRASTKGAVSISAGATADSVMGNVQQTRQRPTNAINQNQQQHHQLDNISGNDVALNNNGLANLDEELTRPSSSEQYVYGYEVEYPGQMRSQHNDRYSSTTAQLQELNSNLRQQQQEKQVQRAPKDQQQDIDIASNSLHNSHHNSNINVNKHTEGDNEDDNEIVMSLSRLGPLREAGSNVDYHRSAHLARPQHSYPNAHQHRFTSNQHNRDDVYGQVVTHDKNPKESWRLTPGQLLKNNRDIQREQQQTNSVRPNNNSIASKGTKTRYQVIGGAERKVPALSPEENHQANQDVYGKEITRPTLHNPLINYKPQTQSTDTDNSSKQQKHQFMIGSTISSSSSLASSRTSSSSESPVKGPPPRDQEQPPFRGVNQLISSYIQSNPHNSHNLHTASTNAAAAASGTDQSMVATNLNLAQNLPLTGGADQDFEGVWHDSPVDGPLVVAHSLNNK